MSADDEPVTQEDVDDLMSCAAAAAHAISVCIAWGDRAGGKGNLDALMLVSAAQAALAHVVGNAAVGSSYDTEAVRMALKVGVDVGVGMINSGVLNGIPRGRVA